MVQFYHENEDRIKENNSVNGVSIAPSRGQVKVSDNSRWSNYANAEYIYKLATAISARFLNKTRNAENATLNHPFLNRIQPANSNSNKRVSIGRKRAQARISATSLNLKCVCVCVRYLTLFLRWCFSHNSFSYLEKNLFFDTFV